MYDSLFLDNHDFLSYNQAVFYAESSRFSTIVQNDLAQGRDRSLVLVLNRRTRGILLGLGHEIPDNLAPHGDEPGPDGEIGEQGVESATDCRQLAQEFPIVRTVEH